MKDHNLLEKAVFGLGLVIILSILGYLSYKTSLERSEPPHLEVVSTYQQGVEKTKYAVLVRNLGEETAVNANIRLSLFQNGKPVESSMLNFDYIPVQSSVKGWAVFNAARKPTDSLVVTSIGYIME